MANESDRDRAARELYDRRTPHWPGCLGLLALADSLRHRCPHCGKWTMQGLAPEVTPERASEMLADLRARRGELGLGS
jgi:hypothetical protein